MGCIARLGCLVVLAALALAAWFTRDRWLPRVTGTHASAPAASSGPTWEPLTAAGAQRTEAALQKLGQPRGPVFATLSGGDVASYVFTTLAKQLPASTDSIRAAVVGDRIGLRASVQLKDLGGALGPLAVMLGDREPVQLSGTLRVVRAGLAEFQVQSAKIGALDIPSAMVPKLLTQIGHGARPAGVDENALPLPVPAFVGDIRVSGGKITLYKSVD